VGDGLVTEGELVRLEPGAIRLDATELEAAIAQGRPAEAVEWWRGDFLAGLDDVGGEAFRTWLESSAKASPGDGARARPVGRRRLSGAIGMRPRLGRAMTGIPPWTSGHTATWSRRWRPAGRRRPARGMAPQ
jgi:hypothetical protein